MSQPDTAKTPDSSRAVRADWVLQVFLGLVMLSSLPLLTGGGEWIEDPARYTRWVLGPVLLAVATIVVASTARRLRTYRERKFWYLICGALLALLLAGEAVARASTGAGLSWLVMTDLLYLVFYSLMAIAALSPPDRRSAGPRGLASVETPGLALSLLGLLAYFVLVPSNFASETYRSWLPSMYLFEVLDILLLFLFGRLIRSAECPRWRALYWLIFGAVTTWATLDAVEALDHGGWISLPEAGAVDLLWTLPVAVLVVASRVHAVSPGATVEEMAGSQAVVPKLANLALASAIAFPLVHLLLSSFGIVDPALQGPREVVVLASVVGLGVVAFLERAQVQRVRWREQRTREAVEAALRESEARYRLLVENAPEAIVIFDPESEVFVDANPRALDLFKLSLEELMTCGPGDLSPAVQPDGRPSAELESAQLELCLAGENLSFEWLSRNALGEDVFCEVFLTSYDLQERRLVRGCLIDITSEVAMREQLRQSQRMESIGQLAGGVAHDFNNLLTVITGYCDLALGRPGLDSGLRRDIGEVRSAGDSATALTSQLLAFSRRQVLRLEPIDLNQVVEDMREMLARLVGEDLKIVVELDPSMREVLADQGQVEQTLMNLAANARDAMPVGGLLALETSIVEVLEGAEPTPDAVPGLYGQLTVSDTGLGMDPATRERVFEPFFTTKGLGHGTGLGLATVYGIVAQTGGFIEVDSGLGEGSRFAVHFPLASDGGGVNAGLRAEPMAPKGRETVLLVEDERAVRDLLCLGLESFGYRVLAAADGEAALEICSRLGDRGADILVTDVVLPGKNGPEVAGEILALQPRIRVIYISGYTDDLLARKGETAEGDSFLQKPFTALKLANEIRSVLDGAMGPDSTAVLHGEASSHLGPLIG